MRLKLTEQTVAVNEGFLTRLGCERVVTRVIAGIAGVSSPRDLLSCHARRAPDHRPDPLPTAAGTRHPTVATRGHMPDAGDPGAARALRRRTRAPTPATRILVRKSQ